MAETIIIDVRTNYTDNMSPAIEASGRAMDKLEQSLQRMNKMMNSLNGNGKFMASFDVQDNASKQMDSIMAGVKRLSGISTIRFAVDIIDRVTQPLQNIVSMVTNAGENVARNVISRGWARVTELDAAKAKLSGLGSTAEEIAEISANASDAVTGTAYSLNEAVTAAASAVAAGIKPGADLRQYLIDIADVAGIAGRSMGEIGSIMDSVVTTGKAQNDTLSRLAERGLPIYQWLAKTLETDEANISKMAKDGEIGIEHLQAAIESNIAGAAQEMGDKTINGVLANINAAYAKLGEAMIGAASDQSTLAGQAHEFLLAYKTDVNKLKGPITEIGKSVADLVAQFRPQAIELMDKAFDGLKDRLDDLNTVMKSPEFQNADLLGKLKIAWDTVIGDPFSQWWDSKGHSMVIDKVTSLGEGIGEGLSTILKGIFGLNAGEGDIVGSATSVGMGFAQGFLAGFDGSGVVEAIAGAFKRALADVFSSITDGKFGAGTLLNGLLLGAGAKGLLGIGVRAGGVIGTIERLFGGNDVAPGIGSMGALSGLAGVARGGGAANIATMMAAMRETPELLMEAGEGAKEISHGLAGMGAATGLAKLGAVAGVATAGVAVYGGIKDLVNAQKAKTEEEKRATTVSGVGRLGAVGVGALAGGIAAGPIGAMIGMGVGGLVGLFAGNAIKSHAANANKELDRLTKGTKEYALAADYATKRMGTLSITTDEVNSAVERVFGSGNVFEHGNAQIASGQTLATQTASTVASVQGMNQQMNAGIALTDAQAEEYVASLNSGMESALSSVTTTGSGMLETLSTIKENSEGATELEKQAYKDYSSMFNDTKTKIEENQKTVSGLVDEYNSGNLTLEQLAQKATPYLEESNRLASEFTGLESKADKVVASQAFKKEGYSYDSIETLSNSFKERDESDKEAYKMAEDAAKTAYALTYGAGTEKYNALAAIAEGETLRSEAQNMSDSLGILNDGINTVIGSDLDKYINSVDWYGAMRDMNSIFSYGQTKAGLSAGEVMGENFFRENDQYSGMVAAAKEYGASIDGWVTELGQSIVGLSEAGMAIPESMMANYENGINILAAAGTDWAIVQAQAIRLAKDANDETSEYHDEALDAINKILSESESYFDDNAVEEAFSAALQRTRWGKNVQEENYEDLNAPEANLAYETDKMKVYEGGGATEGYRYGVSKEKTDHSAERETKEAAKHLVEAGECWWGIARDYLGKEPTMEDVERIKALNPELVSAGLNPGDTVVLSEGTSETGSETGTGSGPTKMNGLDVYEGGGATKGYRYGVGKRAGYGKGTAGSAEEVGKPKDYLGNGFQLPEEALHIGEEKHLAAPTKTPTYTYSKAEEQPKKWEDYSTFGGAIAGTIGNFMSKDVIPKFSEGIKETMDFLPKAFKPKGGSETTPEVEAEGDISQKEDKSSKIKNFPKTKEEADKMNETLPNETLPLQKKPERIPKDLFKTPNFLGESQFQLPSMESLSTGESPSVGETTVSTNVTAQAGSIDTTQIQQEVEASVGSETVEAEAPIEVTTPSSSEIGAGTESAVSDGISTGAAAGAATGKAQAETEINSAIGGISVPAQTITAPITIQPDVHVNSVSVGVGATSGGTGSTTVTVGGTGSHTGGGFAAGGLVDSAVLSWLGEEGYPEMVIPFAPHRRSRALELLAQAEDALGVTRHANGGIVGGMLPSGDGESTEGSGSTKNSGTVQVGGINFTINSSGGGDIVSQVQGRSAEITEIVTNALADALEQAYENTPLAAG